jgi:hypothetical protein
MAAGSPAVLQPLRESDIEAIARWYPKAIVLAGSPVPLSDLLDSSGWTFVLTESGDQQPAGLVVVALDDPEHGWATVALLAIAAQEQRDLAALGVALLEAGLHGQASHVRAAVPLDVGLALYFWLRLGYRPVATNDRLWMIRELDD